MAQKLKEASLHLDPEKELERTHLLRTFDIPLDSADKLLRGSPSLNSVLLKPTIQAYEAWLQERGLDRSCSAEEDIRRFDQDFLPTWAQEEERLKTQCIAAHAYLYAKGIGYCNTEAFKNR